MPSPGSRPLKKGYGSQSLSTRFRLPSTRHIWRNSFRHLPKSCLFTAVNKDTSEIYHELVPFDAVIAQEASDRGVNILRATQAGEMLPRISVDPDYFECRFAAGKTVAGQMYLGRKFDKMDTPAVTENSKLDFNNASPQCLEGSRPETRITSDELKQRLHGRLQEALYYLFPEGKVVQNKFLIGNIHGHAGESLNVELSGDKIGLWYDFATG